MVPVENQGSYTHPTVAEVASPFLSSLSDAKSKLQPTSKIARKCTAFLRLQPLNSPTRFREDPLKDDQRKLAAEIAVLVSEVLPKDCSTFIHLNGIWVTSSQCAISLGAVRFDPTNPRSPASIEQLMIRADEAMYEEKRLRTKPFLMTRAD